MHTTADPEDSETQIKTSGNNRPPPGKMQIRTALYKHSNKSAGSYQSCADDLGCYTNSLTDPIILIKQAASLSSQHTVAFMTDKVVNAFLMKFPINFTTISLNFHAFL